MEEPRTTEHLDDADLADSPTDEEVTIALTPPQLLVVVAVVAVFVV